MKNENLDYMFPVSFFTQAVLLGVNTADSRNLEIPVVKRSRGGEQCLARAVIRGLRSASCCVCTGRRGACRRHSHIGKGTVPKSSSNRHVSHDTVEKTHVLIC